ncbi:WD40-repeat-containing domain protein [Lactarius indigo]|nr:WD40-repeat-containing domain protein [Lactarius indigo]
MSRTILNEPTSPPSSDIIEALSSPEDGIKKSLIIDMKDIVGDAVGNMSISPSYRDLVLAARNGLFIIDLKAPSDVPRFLSQGGTWDVADVQWNPHPARAEYIISTSSEKLLIWNLCLTGKSAIQHVLHSHYRAITDINWHTLDPDIVVSTGIDSWLWAWDLRTPQKPIMGLSTFNAGGTQVKWNRLDGNILASSHLNEVLIWDRRKGSMPVKNIKAHSAKIYGIDWAHNSSRELLTCSLDKTIKLWDVDSSPTGLEGARRSEDIASTLPGGSICEPFSTIHTSYPVWRARDLPFGDGLLSLPQRGGEAPELWTHNTETPHASIPVEAFEGHTDVVKEFVWRRGGRDWGDFQLITWSKDKTLRFWPIDQDVLERAGQPPDKDMPPRSQGYGDNRFSFRTPPETSHTRPALSAPVGQRGILAEVRAMHFAGRLPNPVLLPPRGTRDASQPIHQLPESEPEQTPTVTAISVPPRQGGTMTRGNRSARMDALAWLSSFRVGERARDGSSGTGSGAESGSASRIGSRSRPPSRDANSATLPVVFRKRSDSHGRWDDESEGQSLQDESVTGNVVPFICLRAYRITSVVTRLQQESSRIKLEKHDLEKKRTCTLGLNGPWGESSSVFVRVDLERSPLISIRNRAFMLRRLRMLRETRRPCLEACLRFLLYGNEDERQRRTAHIDYDSSSDEETSSLLRSKRAAIIAPLHSDKNIAEPVTSQGVFGPNGQLVCFSRAPPRIVRNPLHELTSSPSASRPVPADSIPRLFQSPALISDAVRRLARASHDSRISGSDAQRRENGDNILHIMTNLLLFSRLKQRRPSEQSRQLDDIPANYSLLPTHAMTYLGEELAAEYVFDAATPSERAKYNRRDHEDFFVSLGLLLSSYNELSPKAWGANALACTFIKQMYGKFAQEKNIQMLAMLAIMLLKMHVPIAPRKLSALYNSILTPY